MWSKIRKLPTFRFRYYHLIIIFTADIVGQLSISVRRGLELPTTWREIQQSRQEFHVHFKVEFCLVFPFGMLSLWLSVSAGVSAALASLCVKLAFSSEVMLKSALCKHEWMEKCTYCDQVCGN